MGMSSTQAKASSIHPRDDSSQEFEDDDLIRSLEAQKSRTTKVQLGAKLAKPSVVELPPSAGFTFTRPPTSNSQPRTISDVETEGIQGNTSTSETRSVADSHNEAVVKNSFQTSRKVLELSSSKQPAVNAETLKDRTSSAVTIHQSQNFTISPDSVQDVAHPTHRQISDFERLQQLQAVAAKLDTQTLLQLLAYNSSKESKQHSNLVARLRAEIESKSMELDSALASRTEADGFVGQLTKQCDELKKENELLRQQMETMIPAGQAETDMVLLIKNMAKTLDQLLQDKHHQSKEKDELLKAHTTIRQMADDLRQHRAKDLQLSPTKIIDQVMPAIEKVAFSLFSCRKAYQSQAVQCYSTPLSLPFSSPHQQSPVKRGPDLSRVQAESREEEPQEPPNFGLAHHDLDLTETADDTVEDLSPVDTPTANSAVRRNTASARELAIPGSNNKFGKRGRSDVGSQHSMNVRVFKKPTKYSASSAGVIDHMQANSHPFSSRQVGSAELKSIELSLSAVSAAQSPKRSDPSNNKKVRAQGGV